MAKLLACLVLIVTISLGCTTSEDEVQQPSPEATGTAPTSGVAVEADSAEAAVNGASATPEPTTVPTGTKVPTTATPESTPTQDIDRVALLEEFAQLRGDALANREWAFLYAFFPDEFKAKCTGIDFAALMNFFWAFAGIPEGVTFVLEEVRVKGDQGWVEGRIEKDGVEIDFFDDDGDDEPDSIWQGDKWTIYQSPEELAEEDPCSLDSTAEESTSTPSPAPTPEPTLGSRQVPIPFGIGAEVKNDEPTDHWSVTVIDVAPNATDAILAHYEYNDPPSEGNQFYTVTVRVKYLGPDSATFDGGFRLKALGDSAVVYTTFENSCGVIPNELPDPELFTDGEIEGTECWQIASADADSLAMLVEPGFLSDGERVWFSLDGPS